MGVGNDLNEFSRKLSNRQSELTANHHFSCLLTTAGAISLFLVVHHCVFNVAGLQAAELVSVTTLITQCLYSPTVFREVQTQLISCFYENL